MLPLSVGHNHNCAIKANGTVSCWGWNSTGQLGRGLSQLANRYNTPGDVVELGNAVKISAGRSHTCAVRNDNQLLCWGGNAWGHLGIGSQGGSPVRTPTPILSGVVDVAAGEQHTCAVRTTGHVICWGDGFGGRLGTGVQSVVTGPNAPGAANVPGIADAVSVTTGFGHTCVLRSGGNASCWGSNGTGQLGTGTFASSPTPVDVNLGNISSITAGQAFTCAMASGNLYCWGQNNEGALGQLTFEGGDPVNAIPSPTLITTAPGVPPALPVLRAGAGLDHVCAVRTTGGVRCWGKNLHGALGVGNTSDSIIRDSNQVPTGYRQPVDISSLGNVAVVGGGQDHSCARRNDNSITCWGYNQDGQLGNGSPMNLNARSLTPVEVLPL